jgi:hypothetical protein
LVPLQKNEGTLPLEDNLRRCDQFFIFFQISALDAAAGAFSLNVVLR